MANVGYATLQVIPSMQGMGAALSTGVAGPATAAGTTAGTKLGGSLLASVKTYVGPLAAVGAGAALGGFLSGAISSASDLNETVSKVGVIFGEQSGAIQGWAESSATTLGLPKQAALELVAGFGDMFTQLGFGGQVSADMAKGVATLASDLGSFNNLPTEDVAQRIAAAFRGEYDSLQTLIPNINDARVKQEAMATTGKTVESTLTAQEKAAAVLAIVTKDGAKAQGDFARTSGGLANKQKILSAKFADVKAKIGGALVPAMTALVSVGVGVIDFFTKNSAVLGEVFKWVGIVAGVIAAVFLPALISMGVQATISAAKVVAGWVATAASAAAASVMQAVAVAKMVAGWVLMGVQSLIAAGKVALAWLIAMGPIAIVVAAVVGLVALIIANFDTIKEWISGAWDWVKEKTGAAWEWLKSLIGGALTAIWSAITTKFGEIKAAISTAWEGIKTLVAAAIDAVKEKISAVLTAIRVAWSIAWNAVKSFLSGIWEGIKSIAGNAIDIVLGWISGLLGRIEDVKDALFGIGGGIGGGLLGGTGIGGGLVGDLERRGAGAGAAGAEGTGGVNLNVTKHYAGRISAFEEAQEDSRDIAWARALA